MEQDQFSAALEKVYREALQQADKIVAEAEKIRRLAEEELDAVKALHRKAEEEGEKQIMAYYEGRRDQFSEAARTEFLRQLTRKHLEAGRPVGEIASWLDLEEDFITGILEVMKRVELLHQDRPRRFIPPGNPVLEYDSEGRGGTVYFRNDRVKFHLWWEFANRDAIIILDIPNPQQWEARTGLPLLEREDTLRFIGEQVLADQLFGNGSFITGENVMTFYKGLSHPE